MFPDFNLNSLQKHALQEFAQAQNPAKKVMDKIHTGNAATQLTFASSWLLSCLQCETELWHFFYINCSNKHQ